MFWPISCSAYSTQGTWSLSQGPQHLREILNRVPTHRRAQSHMHTPIHTMDNLQMPVSLQRMSSEWGRKSDYPEETPGAWREHKKTPSTQSRGKPQPVASLVYYPLRHNAAWMKKYTWNSFLINEPALWKSIPILLEKHTSGNILSNMWSSKHATNLHLVVRAG